MYKLRQTKLSQFVYCFEGTRRDKNRTLEICYVGPGFPVQHGKLAFNYKWQLVDCSDLIRIFRFFVFELDDKWRGSQLVEPPDAAIDEVKGSFL